MAGKARLRLADYIEKRFPQKGDRSRPIRLHLADLLRSEEVPHSRLTWTMSLSLATCLAGLFSSLWIDTQNPDVFPAWWELTAAIVAVSSGLCAIVFLVSVLTTIILPHPGGGKYRVERIAKNVLEFNNILMTIRGSVKPDRASGDKFIEEVRSDLEGYMERYYSVLRDQFLAITLSAIFSLLFTFSGLYLAELTLDMWIHGHTPGVHKIGPVISSNPLLNLLSAMYSSMVVLVTMGFGPTTCLISDLTVFLQVSLSGILIFFGLSVALAFYQQASTVRKGEVIAQLRKELLEQSR